MHPPLSFWVSLKCRPGPDEAVWLARPLQNRKSGLQKRQERKEKLEKDDEGKLLMTKVFQKKADQ